MRYLQNIEKSGFHRGEYVGYANGVWRIRKRDSQRRWVARHAGTGKEFCTETLTQISEILETKHATRKS